ncbi:MAG: repressor LexA [Elusimicrobia bacterium RIFCSPLOWO2_01_FULL_60_11]|nr:MAG: repressor LexA [Elusimicrobia bacterium RIFCSPLOWO2_01_FULL_60_11]
MQNLNEKESKVLDALSFLTDKFGFSPSLQELADKAGFKSRNTASYYLEKLKKKGFKLPSPSSVFHVPVLGSVPAGPVATMAEEREDMLTLDASLVGSLSADRGRIFALKVKGDSMLDAGIWDGDLVIVRIQPAASEGDIVVARFGDEATVKYLRRLRPTGVFPGGLYLVPANEKYSPIPMVGPSDQEGAVIVGKVVSVIRKYLR